MPASLKVNWEGSLFVHHSLGMVNREMLLAFAGDRRFDVCHIPYEADQFSIDASPEFAALRPVLKPPHVVPDVLIRHRWPPDFSRPACGAFVLFQPWEYGSLPIEWVEKIPQFVDEVWVYTDYLRECYRASGIDEKIIRVIPLGVDPARFHPDAAPCARMRDVAGDRFCFFFNGGATLRKGIDILVNAYAGEFDRSERVCLIIKGSRVYGGGLGERIAALAERTDIAPLIYLTDDLPPAALPGLYTACDCYVHPYRSEGYGLPIAEAMACGRPVIVTGAGAARDFTDENTAYLVKCSLEKLPAASAGGLPTVANPFWILPDMLDLRRHMRYVYDHRGEAAATGGRAGTVIRRRHTWVQAADKAKERILALGVAELSHG
jgi:glycosyltransferase involved in cell wall biosynthesis